mgnify:CR=1 FL=1
MYVPGVTADGREILYRLVMFLEMVKLSGSEK